MGGSGGAATVHSHAATDHVISATSASSPVQNNSKLIKLQVSQVISLLALITKIKLLQGGAVTNSPCIGLWLRWSQMELGWGVQTEGVSGL